MVKQPHHLFLISDHTDSSPKLDSRGQANSFCSASSSSRTVLPVSRAGPPPVRWTSEVQHDVSQLQFHDVLRQLQLAHVHRGVIGAGVHTGSDGREEEDPLQAHGDLSVSGGAGHRFALPHGRGHAALSSGDRYFRTPRPGIAVIWFSRLL